MTDSFSANGASQTVMLSDGVTVYYNGANELRLRKGIWNFEEAILTLDDLSEEHRASLVTSVTVLRSGAWLDTDRLPNSENLTPLERDEVAQMFLALRDTDYLCDGADAKDRRLLAQILGGIDEYAASRPSSDRPVLFVADTDSVRRYAVSLSADVSLQLDVMSPEDFSLIAREDLTTRVDAYRTREGLGIVRRIVEPYGCIVGCLERPHIRFLRNLNRVLVETSQPLVLGLLDGPFTTLFTIKPPETGCFECFEQRLLARMEDMPSYHRFVAEAGDSTPSTTKTDASPLMHGLAAQALFEGLIVHRIGKAKLAGRVLNTYVPLMEIQVQPLLRVPFCPACGFIAGARMEEMYSSSKKIVDRVVNRIALVED
ncbi:MAG: hypothetical protein JO240_16705 [Solirubrobacterales bacterium]|nr:hypothetical protein [Solirubrobacterales bacterium]